MIELWITLALAFGCGLAIRGPIAVTWWRSRVTIAQARVKTLEGELAAAQMCVAAGRDVYLRRVETCADCVFCNASTESFTDLTDYQPGDAT